MKAGKMYYKTGCKINTNNKKSDSKNNKKGGTL